MQLFKSSNEALHQMVDRSTQGAFDGEIATCCLAEAACYLLSALALYSGLIGLATQTEPSRLAAAEVHEPSGALLSLR